MQLKRRRILLFLWKRIITMKLSEESLHAFNYYASVSTGAKILDFQCYPQHYIFNKNRAWMLQALKCPKVIYFPRSTLTTASGFQFNELKQLTFVHFCCVQMLLLFSGLKTFVRLSTTKNSCRNGWNQM